jgi:hypothetical protein
VNGRQIGAFLVDFGNALIAVAVEIEQHLVNRFRRSIEVSVGDDGIAIALAGHVHVLQRGGIRRRRIARERGG